MVGCRDRCPGESRELPIQAMAQCCFALLSAFGWVSEFSTYNTEKHALIYVQSQPRSLVNEEAEAGSRSESWGDLPMVELPLAPELLGKYFKPKCGNITGSPVLFLYACLGSGLCCADCFRSLLSMCKLKFVPW